MALVVVSVGLLGLAKMESLALSSTSVAGVRSVAAGQAANLAAMMHANQDYWQATTLPVPLTISFTSATIPAATACTTSGIHACTPQAMANYDVNLWATNLQKVMPVYLATITCNTTPTTGITVSCAISVSWPENAVAANGFATKGTQQSAASIQASTSPTYILYVQP